MSGWMIRIPVAEFFSGDREKGYFTGRVMLKRTQFDNMFKAGDSSTVRIGVETEDIRPTPEAVARYFGGPKYQMTPETHQRVCQGIQQAVGMVDPVVCYRAIPIREIEKACKITSSGGACADILPDSTDGHARYFAAYVATLGRALESTCRDLVSNNSIYQSLLLDSVGTAMLDAVGLICNDMLEMHSRHMDLFTGCRLGPGLNGISMESQALLFELLKEDSAGVCLNEAFIMQPAKSISGFVVYSDIVQRKPSGGKCLQCEMKHCQFRTK